MPSTSRILITPGEPAGIGPDIVVQAAQQRWPVELIAVGDPELLAARANRLGLPLNLIQWNSEDSIEASQPSSLKFIPVTLSTPSEPGYLNKKNASYVIECLKLATQYCLQNLAQALVTGPIQKSILNEAGIPFTGHTEFLAKFCGIDNVIMLFVAPGLRVALATTHLPLAKVSQTITKKLLIDKIRLLHKELKNRFSIRHPRILVCGLNPHAGENGHLGNEELEIISPALAELAKENINVSGPFPADTAFTHKNLQESDAVFAMYHDQALPVVKYAGFGQVVNVTLGLPIIRTSVDHGTALDIAGTQQADPSSLIHAIQLAIELLPPC